MKKGFTFIELLVVMTISSVVALAIFSATKYFSYSIKGNSFKTILLKDAHNSMAYLTKDIGYAVTLDDTIMRALGNLNSDQSLSVRIPSVDSNGEPILDAGYNFLYYDYIYFYKDDSDSTIKKVVKIDPVSISAYSSSRASEDGNTYVIAEHVQSLVFTDNTGGAHSTASIGDIIDGNVSGVSSSSEITTYIEEISKVGITITFVKKMPSGHYGDEVTKTLVTQVFALRNKA